MVTGYLTGNEPFAKNTLNSNTANTCAGVWALNMLNHKITIFIGIVSCFQQSCLSVENTTHCAGGAVLSISHTQNTSTASEQEFAPGNL